MANEDRLSRLRQQLGLTESDLPDDDLPVVLNSLLVSATRDKDPRNTLQAVKDALIATALLPEIEVFTSLPILLPCADDAADDVLTALAEECSGKEMIIALQEAVERLSNNLTSISDDDDDERTESNGPEEAETSRQVLRLIKLYTKVLPRLSKGKKTPAQIICPPISQLEGLLYAVAPTFAEKEVNALVQGVTALIVSAAAWAGTDDDVKNLLYTFATATLQACADKLGTDVATRAFEEQFPRLRMSNAASTSAEQQTPVTELSNTLLSLGINIPPNQQHNAVGTLILLAYTYSPAVPLSLTTLQANLPALLASFQSGTAVPSALALLIRTLGPLISQSPRPSIPEDLLATLTSLLPSVASLHPDPALRHITFRVLSLILSLAPPIIRLHLLRDLVSPAPAGEEGQPWAGDGMQVASVGLVKEAVLEALSPTAPGGANNVFASTMFVRTLAPVLFVARLPEPSQNPETDLEEFLESPEPLRLVEVFGLYFILVKRDVQNKTGIREPDVINTVQANLLHPVKKRLREWDNVTLQHDDHSKLRLDILEIWLTRIEEAVQSVEAERANTGGQM